MKEDDKKKLKKVADQLKGKDLFPEKTKRAKEFLNNMKTDKQIKRKQI